MWTRRSASTCSPARIGASADTFGPGAQVVEVGVTVPAASGTAFFLANGDVAYIPATGFVGTDTFSYTVSTPDGAGGVISETGTITVTVTDPNDAPTVAAPGFQNVAEDTALVFTAANGNAIVVADNDGDPVS
ncbi:MAG: Ig-like domain-containing protein, partial [Pseudomonadota bacterium]